MTNQSSQPSDTEARGLAAQIGQTRAAFMRLAHAHIDLLRAEISAILDQVKQMAAAAGVALLFALLFGNMLYIGGFLFVGEWLFGSIGWGLAQGLLLALAIMVIAALVILGVGSRTFVISFVLAALFAIAVCFLIGLNLTYNTADYFAGQLASPFNNVGLVAAIGGGVIGAAIFLVLLMLAGGLFGAVAGLIIGLIVGAIMGWLMGGAPWTWPPAVGFSVTAGLALWPILCAVLGWRQIDLEARFGHLYPRQSIEAANETKAWLEEQWRTRLPTRGKK
jgi:hypothetical protein